MLDELDYNAVGITFVISAIIAWLFFTDPLNAGMDRVNLWGRIIGIGVGAVVSYFVAARMLDN